MMDTILYTLGKNEAIIDANFKAVAKAIKNHNKALLLMDLSLFGLLALNHIQEKQIVLQDKKIDLLKKEVEDLKRTVRAEEDELK